MLEDLRKGISEEYTEKELREMFIEMFFWVSEDSIELLREAIKRRKEMLKKNVKST